jgi:hypothetical protein
MTRRCGRCGELKPLEDFAWRRKNIGQRHNYCRPCHSAYHRQHYLANRQRYIDQAQANKRRARREKTEQLLGYFATHPCVDCGETDPLVLEFDHVSDDKSFEVARAMSDKGWATILDEIAKCEVVCANCHRRRTYRRRGALRVLLTEG